MLPTKPEYRIYKDCFLDGVHHRAGEIIETDTASPSQNWVPVNDEARQVTREFRSRTPYVLNVCQTIKPGDPSHTKWVNGERIYRGE